MAIFFKTFTGESPFDQVINLNGPDIIVNSITGSPGAINILSTVEMSADISMNGNNVTDIGVFSAINLDCLDLTVSNNATIDNILKVDEIHNTDDKHMLTLVTDVLFTPNNILSVEAGRLFMPAVTDFGGTTNPTSVGLSPIGGRMWNNGTVSPPTINWTTTSGNTDLTNPYAQDLSVLGTPTFNGTNMTGDVDMNANNVSNIGMVEYADIAVLYRGFGTGTVTYGAGIADTIDNLTDGGGLLDGWDFPSGNYTTPSKGIYECGFAFIVDSFIIPPTRLDYVVLADGNPMGFGAVLLTSIIGTPGVSVVVLPPETIDAGVVLQFTVQIDQNCDADIFGRIFRFA